MSEGLTFRIHPEGNFASLDLFVRTLEDVRRLLIEVDYAVTRERSGKRWVIAQLQSSDPTFTIAPANLDLREPMDAIVDGISKIDRGVDEPPQYFTEDVLERLLRMRRHFRGHDGANHISVSANGHETVKVTREIAEKVNKILHAGYWSLGSLEGRLEAFNFHNRPTFTIWDRVSRAPVRCSTPNNQEWREQVKSLLEKRVLVRGRIRYFSNGIPRSISHILDISDNTPDPALPKAEFGCIPDRNAAENPIEFLNSIRGLERN